MSGFKEICDFVNEDTKYFKRAALVFYVLITINLFANYPSNFLYKLPKNQVVFFSNIFNFLYSTKFFWSMTIILIIIAWIIAWFPEFSINLKIELIGYVEIVTIIYIFYIWIFIFIFLNFSGNVNTICEIVYPRERIYRSFFDLDLNRTQILIYIIDSAYWLFKALHL